MINQINRYILENTPQDIADLYARLPYIAENTDFGLLDDDIVVIDTETTGVSLKKDELTQIAAARMSKGKITNWYITFVNPNKEIPSDIMYLTNITNEDVENAPSSDIALRELTEFVGNSKIVAHNATFDKNFLTKHPSGYPLLENIWIDSLELAKIALPRMKSHRLIDLVKAFNAPVSTHRADDDVEATCALFRILLAAVYVLPIEIIQKINEISKDSDWPTKIVFKEIQNIKNPQNKEFVFSLNSIRKQRVWNFTEVKKRDAADLINEKYIKNKQIKIQNNTSQKYSISFPSQKEIFDFFKEDGLYAKNKEDYEIREAQIDMAVAVRDAFEVNSNLIIEAGTGVGKSLSYLVPAAYFAKMNNITVGVATKTNSLLDQLIYKELPQLNEVIGDLSYGSLKGFNHYICLLKLKDLLNKPAQTRFVFNEERSQAPSISAILSFVYQSDYDDIDNLKIDYRALPKNLFTISSRDCLRRKCQYYNDGCFVIGARKLAESVDILVTNHTLLFCDIATDNSLLPPIRYWICDEAHGVETEARNAFTLKISDKEINSFISKIGGFDTKKNIYKKALRILGIEGSANNETLMYGLLKNAIKNGEIFTKEAEIFLAEFPQLLFFNEQKKSGYEQIEIWINEHVRNSEIFKRLAKYALDLQKACERVIDSSQKILSYLDESDSVSGIQRELAALILDLKDLNKAIDIIFINADDEYVYSALLHKHLEKGENYLYAQPYNVGKLLEETFYNNTKSVVYTSATLSVDGSFKPFKDMLGLNGECKNNTNEMILKSHYDFNKNMKVFVVKDIPEPSTSNYLEQMTDLLINIHLAQKGSVLTLFTNKKEMESMYPAVKEAMEEIGLRVVCQKSGVSVKGLKDDFLKDETLSLFALKSFWEGFDAPGATLKAVVIPKLPFTKPSDPLNRERDSRDNYAWKKYTLPKSIIDIKQAAGRLLRRSDDTGIFIIADSRVVTKFYGRTIINSLPSNNIEFVSKDDLPKKIEENVFDISNEEA